MFVAGLVIDSIEFKSSLTDKLELKNTLLYRCKTSKIVDD